MGIQKNIPDLLSSSKIGISCSSAESFGLNIVEYGLASLPIVCSDISCFNRLLNFGEFGELYESDNVNSMCEKIINVVSNYNIYHEKASKFNLYIQKHYSEKIFLRNVDLILSSI